MRIKKTIELKDTHYPEHMLWVPVQDVVSRINARINVYEDNGILKVLEAIKEELTE